MFAPLIKKPTQIAAPAPARGILQSKCAHGTDTPLGGLRMSFAGKESGLERKLAIGLSSDPLEREADRLAEQVSANEFQPNFSRIPLSAPRLAPPESERPVPLDAFPHADVIRRRLGRPIPAHAVVDPAGCAGLGAPAFTRDGQAYFSSPSPTLRVAAHEAAHVLQQRGATRDLGLGAERHAAAVEQIVAGGGNARALLGDRGASTGGGPHYYTVIPDYDQSPGNWDAGADIRLSDDRLMAVEDTERGSRNFWANIDKLIESNAILKQVESPFRLSVEGTKLIGPAPKGAAKHTLFKMQILDLDDEIVGEDVITDPDCGTTARRVMGARRNEKMAATYKNVLPVAAQGSATPEVVYADPNVMEKDVLKGAMGMSNPQSARKAYELMTPATRDWFDKKAGINKYASVKTGEAYAISTGPDLEGQGPKMRPATEDTPGDFNFHWGGVVMTSGSDQVTLENYFGQRPSDWGFQMYGTAKGGQSFHEQHLASDEQGVRPITMSVRKRTGK